ncbi:thioesterase superfamily protein [Jatrophihabitans sp. GAS493]|uniref:thioesterase family protein n=1 Tax=Jatrophihabitans sp. GAS493 TaxID=1907575 RepID=UPI000BB7A01D|nr:thioesterase family protein [Jatrophihabitans sp. GAS493]SOD74524.1 thioesterase superfamily protein [Jatrophihabitans sp. GAS493]
MEPTPFSLVSSIAANPLTAHQFRAEVDPEWTIGGKPNGGYLLAMMGRAAAAVGQHQHVIAASAHYLSSPDPGPVNLEAEVLRGGRSASQVRVRMEQEGRPRVEALFTTGTLDVDTKPFWEAGLPPRPVAQPDECLRIPSSSPSGLRVAIMDQVDLRIEPSTLGFANGAPSGRGELRGWLALPAGEAFDPTSLLYAVDAFPPATFEIELTGWVPTLELTVYVRALPAPGPVQVLQRAQLIDAQRVDEACYVWDSTGRLVAHGTQLAGIRLG